MQDQAKSSLPVTFSGDSKEFFGIWIVNVCLTILTLGIYSAWAKVRTYRYFYSHTRVDNHAFRYLATPLQILVGRVIAAAIFAVYMFSSSFSPMSAVFWVGLFIFGTPWLINKSVGFGLRMTSYRNIRFNFHGSYGDAFLYFVALPITIFLSLGLTYPWVKRHMDGYIYNNISFAGKQNRAALRTTQYYWTFLIIAAAGLLIALAAVPATMLFAALLPLPPSGEQSWLSAGFTVASLIMNLAVLTTLRAIFHARIRNHIYNNSEFTELGRLQSTIPVHGFVALMLTNFVAIIFSLGLAYPWAKIRKARYLCAHTTLIAVAEWEALADEATESSSALAEEAAGLFDVEIGLT